MNRIAGAILVIGFVAVRSETDWCANWALLPFVWFGILLLIMGDKLR